MTNRQTALKKERSKLLDFWRTANTGNKSAILEMISDIDDELESFNLNSTQAVKQRKFIRKNAHHLKRLNIMNNCSTENAL